MEMKLEDYLHGDCHIFAQALHQVFGYKMSFAIDECDLELGGETLIHAFCQTEAGAMDGRGFVTESELTEPYDYSFLSFQKVDMAEVKRWEQSGFLHETTPEQLAEAIRFIEENKERYQMKAVA